MASSFTGDEERVGFNTLERGTATFAAVFVALSVLAQSLWAADTPSRLKYEVTGPEALQAVSQRGGRLLAEYGSFQLWDLPADQHNALEGRKGISPRNGDDVIELHSGAIHTAIGMAQNAAPAVAAFTGKRLHLVQFAGPIRPDWYNGLQEGGLRIVSHIPRNAYLVYGDSQALARLRTVSRVSPHIQWEGDYQAAYKIHPGASRWANTPQVAEASGDLFAVQLVDDGEANTETLNLLDGFQRAWLRQTRQLGYVNCVLRLPVERLAEIAARPDVVSIQPYKTPEKRDERQGQIMAGNLIGDQLSGPGYLGWLASRGFTPEQFVSSGFLVDVSDSGIDNGTQNPGHFGLYTLGNRNLASRIVYNRLVGTPNFGSTIEGCDGHGNINSHIIAGYNDLKCFPHTDTAGYHYGLGICPFVRVGSSVIFDPDLFTYPDYAELQSRAFQNGARISCNSWGASLGGAYTVDSQIYDALVRDAQPTNSPFPAAGNQEMVIVFAAGNAGPGENTIGAPATAKNVITVGAAENLHSHSTTNGGNNTAGTDGCTSTDADADSINDIVGFSSRGPCDDLRAKPDIVAPGTHITGGVAQQASPGPNGLALECFRATGVCALPGSGSQGNADNFFPKGQQFFTTSSGTSHSCPAVAGGASLLRQYFINHNWAVPSPAMTKAWFMNSTRYMIGISSNDALPSVNQGMGSMHLGMAFDGLPRIRRDQREEDRFTATGQTRVFQGYVVDSTKPFRVTLAWTDAPGSTAANAYNNDLNLTVVAGGQTYRGNVFVDGLSVPGGTADARNNAESVFLPAGLTGPFTVTVTAANINSDGVPNNADALDQDFALVIYNSSDSEVLLVPAGATIQAESCAGQGVIDPGETVTVNLALRNFGRSNTTSLVATLLPVGGVISPGGQQTYGTLSGNGAPAVSRPFTFVAGGPCGSDVIVTLQLQDGTNDYGTVEFPFRMGTLTTNNTSSSNVSPITITASNSAVTPYPSPIWIGNVQGKISRVTVTLDGLSHSWPDDLDVLLVGPQRQAIMLLSDAGGGSDVTNLTLVFDSSAILALPDDTPLTSGTWRPTDYSTDVSLPAPAPTAPYAVSMSSLLGRTPNGFWRLYVADDYGSDDGGQVLRGWSVTLTVTNPLCCVESTSADLALTVSDTPDPISVSNVVTYTLRVINNGPAAASDVTLLGTLPSGVAFLQATLSQGNYTQTNNVVTCNFGNLIAGNSATATINAQVIGGPQVETTASVTAAESDPNPVNNVASATTSVTVPSLAVQNTTAIEGNTGTNFAVFLLALSQPSAQVVQVSYFTTNGTALAGLDYMAVSNQAALLPGEIAYSIKVPIIADVVDENDKTFGVWLANPLNASLSNAFANATILDDDPSPAVSISNAALAEGNTGTTNAVFSISLSAPSSRSIQVSCSTGNGTALAGEDFIAFTNRPVAFAPGQTVSNIAVTVKGDIEAEPNETFTVVLSNPTNAVLGAAVGTGTIMSDDLAPLIQAVDYRIEAESGTNNGVIEPGEVITVSLALINNGSANTTNLVATLQPTGGVNSPSNPQTYGVLQAGGPQISRSFSFTVGTSNCGTLRLSFALDDAGASHGTIAFDQPVGNCFYDDFEPNIDLAQWSSLGGILGSTLLATNHGGSVSPVNSLWFSDNGSRFAATRAINTLGGGVISFYLRLANGTISGRWETVDLPTEAVVLEYSTNNGVAWTPMASYSNASYYAWTGVSESIPPAAQTAATLFRWRQLAHSGSCCDQWALDDVAAFIGPQPPVITTQPQSQTAISGSGVILNVTAAGSSPLSYQWRLFGTNLPGATTEVLTLINVTSNKAGPYSVIVTNLFGSTVSSNALVSVVPGISLSQAVDAPELIWTTGGNSNWVGQAGVTHDGADAAQTGGITHSQTNWLQTTVTGPGMLTFWWKVSSEADFDYLRFAVDANVQASLAGEVNWQQRTHLISTGAHTLRWTYAKDAGGNAGQDKAWVDQVVFTPDFGALHHFVWNPIGSTQTVNVPFPVTLTAQDTANNPVTNYSGAPNLSAYALVGQNVGTILDNPVHTTGNNGDWTLGYAFTPNKNLVVTHVRHYFGNRVSIWTDSGTLLASQNVVGPSGTWTETELTTPLQLVAGTGYRVGVYNGGGAYYWRTDLGTTFADGTIDQSYSISGDAFPSDADPIHWWLVNLRYVVGSTVPVVITPTIAGTFVNGVWSGSITASQAGTNVSLLASDGSGRNGVSSSFVVALPPSAPPVILQQPAGQTVSTGHSATFNVLANGTQPLLYQWRLNGTNLSGATNSALMLSDVTVNDTGNYSVVVSNSVGSAISSNALLTVVAPSGLSALLIWDSANGGTAALSNALAKAGIAVTLSSAVENSYDGSNPSPGVFNVVIHLNGTTYNDDMPLAGQNMLVNYVQSGGGYIHSEWDAYEYGAGRMLKMRDLILLDCAGFSEGNVSVSDVPAQSGHPILANVPSNFTFQAGFNIGPAHVFPTNPVTVLMRDLGMNDAVVIREFGSGRIVGFSHAGNYDGGTAFETLLNTNVQRLYVDAVLWAARSATNPPAIAIQPPSILSDGSFALWLKHTDGSPITPAEAAYTYLYWTTNIAVPFATWQPASNPLVLTNGMLRVGGLNISNAARQFFRAEQTP